MRGHIIGHVLVYQRLAVPGAQAKIDDRRQRLPIDFDQRDSVLSDIAVVGNDHSHRFADEADLIYGEGALCATVGQAGVRHDEWRRLIEVAQVGGRVDGAYAGVCPGGRRVEVIEPCVSVGAAQDRGVQNPRRIDVVDV